MRLRTLFRTADTGAPTGGDAPAAPAPTDAPAATFTKDDVERIVKERLERAQKRAEADQAKAAEEARVKALAEQGEWRTLAEQHATRIAELEQHATKIPTLEQDRDRYRGAVTTLLKTQRADLPKPIQDLLDKLDPVDQLEWIAANRATLNATPGTGTPPRIPAKAGAPQAPPDPNRRSTINF